MKATIESVGMSVTAPNCLEGAVVYQLIGMAQAGIDGYAAIDRLQKWVERHRNDKKKVKHSHVAQW